VSYIFVADTEKSKKGSTSYKLVSVKQVLQNSTIQELIFWCNRLEKNWKVVTNGAYLVAVENEEERGRKE
jgi:ribosomal protein RSM22 (predicted rRNA methylase)